MPADGGEFGTGPGDCVSSAMMSGVVPQKENAVSAAIWCRYMSCISFESMSFKMKRRTRLFQRNSRT